MLLCSPDLSLSSVSFAIVMEREAGNVILQESRSDCTFLCFSGGSSRVPGDCGFAGSSPGNKPSMAETGELVILRFPVFTSVSGERFGSTASGGG